MSLLSWFPHAASLFQDGNPEDCPVCMTTFDDISRRPRTLPCGHTMCGVCVNALKAEGQVTCPTCRTTHALPQQGQFPISYVTEAFIRRLRGAATVSPLPKPGKDTRESAPSLGTAPAQQGPAGLSKLTRSLLQDQEAKVLAAIHACQEEQAQLRQYHTTLRGWGERQQDLEDQLQALVDQSKGARTLVRQEEAKVEARQEQTQQREQQLHTMLQELRTAATRLDAYDAMKDADRCIGEESERMEECLAVFPDVHTVTTVTKVSVLPLPLLYPVSCTRSKVFCVLLRVTRIT